MASFSNPVRFVELLRSFTSAPPATRPSDAAHVRRLSARSRRVILLIFAIVAISLGDLELSLTYLRTVGMGEANPMARIVMEYNSPAILVAWKCATVALACLIFARFRRRTSTEIACWCCIAVLTWLSFRWSAYSAEAGEMFAHHAHVAVAAECPNWVHIDN